MDGALLPLLIALAALLALDVSALRWGQDSRHESDPANDWS